MESMFDKNRKDNMLRQNGEADKVIDWDKIMNPKIEGTLYYKGFKGHYWKGDEDDGDQDYFAGEATNLNNAIFALEGNSQEAIKLDFQGMVDDFLENLQNTEISNPIEFYTTDPNILDYYNNHHRKKRHFNIRNDSYEQEIPLRMAA
jgi:hypothetical protein